MLCAEVRECPLAFDSGNAEPDMGGGDIGESVVALITLTLCPFAEGFGDADILNNEKKSFLISFISGHGHTKIKRYILVKFSQGLVKFNFIIFTFQFNLRIIISPITTIKETVQNCSMLVRPAM